MHHLLIAQQTRNNCQVLILEPSRELAATIAKLVNKLGEFMQAQCVAYTGGLGGPCVRNDIHIVVGTPGRVCDMILRRALRVDLVNIVVLDYADEMLSRGWKDQIYEVFKSAPQRVQVCLFSQTVPVEAHSIMSDFMREPVRIFKARDSLVSIIEVREIAPLCQRNCTVLPLACSGHCLTSFFLLQDAEQFYAEVEDDNAKRDALCGLKEVIGTGNGNIVFVRSRIQVDLLFEQMRSMGFRVACVHDDMEQKLRDEIMIEYRGGRTAFLITTHAFAHQLEVAQFALVINYDLPTIMDHYIQSVYRCGLFGRKKIAINFVTPEDKQVLDLDWSVVCKTRIDALPANLSSV